MLLCYLTQHQSFIRQPHDDILILASFRKLKEMIVRVPPGGEQIQRKTGSQVDLVMCSQGDYPILQFPGDLTVNFAAEVKEGN